MCCFYFFWLRKNRNRQTDAMSNCETASAPEAANLWAGMKEVILTPDAFVIQSAKSATFTPFPIPTSLSHSWSLFNSFAGPVSDERNTSFPDHTCALIIAEKNFLRMDWVIIITRTYWGFEAEFGLPRSSSSTMPPPLSPWKKNLLQIINPLWPRFCIRSQSMGQQKSCEGRTTRGAALDSWPTWPPRAWRPFWSGLFLVEKTVRLLGERMYSK